jgi:hypothetical protein
MFLLNKIKKAIQTKTDQLIGYKLQLAIQMNELMEIYGGQKIYFHFMFRAIKQ